MPPDVKGWWGYHPPVDPEYHRGTQSCAVSLSQADDAEESDHSFANPVGVHGRRRAGNNITRGGKITCDNRIATGLQPSLGRSLLAVATHFHKRGD